MAGLGVGNMHGIAHTITYGCISTLHHSAPHRTALHPSPTPPTATQPLHHTALHASPTPSTATQPPHTLTHVHTHTHTHSAAAAACLPSAPFFPSPQVLLTASYPTPVPIPSQPTLLLIARLIRMDDAAVLASGRVPASASLFADLQAALPALHAAAWQLLGTLLQAAGSGMLPLQASLTRLLCDQLRRVRVGGQAALLTMPPQVRACVQNGAGQDGVSGGRKGLNSHASCLMPYAPCLMPHASCNVPRVPCLVPHTSCYVPHATCLVPHASCPMPRVPCLVPRASCPMLHASQCFMQTPPHAACTAPHLTLYHSTVPHFTSHCITAQYRTSPHTVSQHSTALHLTLSQHSTALHLTMTFKIAA